MSKTRQQDSEKDFKGIKWDQELEDDSLATLQRRLEVEFEADFESSQYEQKGFSKQTGLPFYTDCGQTIRFNNKEVVIGVERTEDANSLEFWVDDSETMELFDEFVGMHAIAQDEGPVFEPYRYRRKSGAEVRDLLVSFSDHFQLEGPERRPGNGKVRLHPLKQENIVSEDKYLYGDTVQQINENSGAVYTGNEMYIPGDAQFQIEGLQEQDPADLEITGELRIKPKSKRKNGIYNIEIEADEEHSLMYLINHASSVIE